MKIYDLDELTIIDIDDGSSGTPGEASSPADDNDDSKQSDNDDSGKSDNDDSGQSDDSNNSADNQSTSKSNSKPADQSDSDSADSNGDGTPGDYDTDDDDDLLNKISKEVQDILDNRVEQPGEIAEPPLPKSSDRNNKSKGPMTIQQKDIVYKAKMDWSQLVKLFTAVAHSQENTRTKITGKSATAAAIGNDLGATAMPPAQRKILDGIKLITAFDTSGSMSMYVAKMLTEVQSLVVSQSPNIVGQVGVLYYADSSIKFALDVQDKIAWGLNSLLDLESRKIIDKSNTITMQQLLSSFASGGTTFSSDIAQDLIQMGAKGYNVLLGTDSDILWDDNWVNFVSVFNALKGKLFLVCATPDDFQRICKKIGFAPAQFTFIGGN